MSKRILVAVDGSDAAIEAARFAATEWPEAAVTLLHVINPAESSTGAEGGFPGAVEQWYENAHARGERVLDRAAEAVERDVETRLEVGRPTRMILEAAHGSEPVETRGADDGDGEDSEPEASGDGIPFDHVVLASRGRTGLSRMFLGSVAEGVVRRAEIPVTVVR